MRASSAEVADGAGSEVWDLGVLYRVHADFVYRTLARFGVPESDRADQLQEVFVVVHRRLSSYRGEAKITTWLYGIARRVAAAYRRRAFRRHEDISAQPLAGTTSPDSPETNTEHARARKRLETILNSMSIDHRAVFVMFEIDEMTGQEIATLLDCPLQTVFSRLRRARETFERQVARLRATQERKAG